MSSFDLDKFRKEFLTSDGWKVSDVYKTYNDEFLRKDAQDAYEGAKWAWNHQQKKVDVLEIKMNKILDYLDSKTEETWKSWKENADMMDQGASNAYEDAYCFVKNIVEDNIENTIEEKD